MPPQAGSLSSPFPTRLRQRGRQPQARSPQPDEGRPSSVMLAAGGRGRGPSPFPAIVRREGRSLGRRRLPRRRGGTGNGRPRAVLEGRASPGDAIPRMCLPNAAGSIAAVKRLGARHDGVSVAAEIVRRPTGLPQDGKRQIGTASTSVRTGAPREGSAPSEERGGGEGALVRTRTRPAA